MQRSITALGEAVRREGFDGWLFFGFQHRDPLAEELLQLSSTRVNTRRWFYLLAPELEQSIKICHQIESAALDSLPGSRILYSSQDELLSILGQFNGRRLAVQYSPELPIFSYLDHGTAKLLTDAGIELYSSGNLIQAVKGVLDSDGIASHCRAADHLDEIVTLVVERLRRNWGRRKTSLYEGEVQGWILEEFSRRRLVCDHPPIVASGQRSSDPHYAPLDHGFEIMPEEILQLDLWAKEEGPAGIYADISRVFYTGAVVPDNVQANFTVLSRARDGVLQFLNNELPNRKVFGYEADAVCRKILGEAELGRYIRHRTGHGIDTLPHGYGVNLDSVEFPDARPFMEGSCFSIEPGLYLEDYGIRTEINAYIRSARAVVSGGTPQNEIVTLV